MLENYSQFTSIDKRLVNIKDSESYQITILKNFP